MKSNCKIRQRIQRNSIANRKSVALFVNCGDPGLDTTYSIIQQCIRNGVDILELGVPFPNSFSDGETIKKSHVRALANRIDLDVVLDFLSSNRHEMTIPVVLLVDYSHSVRPIGIERLAERSSSAGVDGILCHGLPPLLISEYHQKLTEHGISPIFSLYPNSPEKKILETSSIANGFIYLVSQYGRTGGQVNFTSTDITDFYRTVRTYTDLPLLAGFGIKNMTDLVSVFRHNAVDGAIIGSSISSIVESSILMGQFDSDVLYKRMEEFLNTIEEARNINTEYILQRKIV